jgi:hypothetical protein
METPFALAAEAVRDIARWERWRIEFMHWQALVGGIQPPPIVAFAGWRQRLKGIEGAAGILTVLADHELAARALDPRLSGPILCALRPPSMWPVGPSGTESPLTGDTPQGG